MKNLDGDLDQAAFRGRLRYNESLRFYVERLSDKSRFRCSDYAQTFCTRDELLRFVDFDINENDEACNIAFPVVSNE